MDEAAAIAKLQDDLNAVEDKVKLCREMLPHSAGVEKDELLAEIVGFLEACQPRLLTLIEAGTQGQLTEEMFMLCLQA